MKANPFHAAALAFLLVAGCAQPSALLVRPAGQSVSQGATLHLKLDLGRRTQVLVSEVTSLGVSVEVPGRAPINQNFTQAQWLSDALDFSGLPAGNATIKVYAYGAQGQQLGQGGTLVPLLIGRRTLAQVQIALSSEGKSDLLPFGPMKQGTYSVEPATDSIEPTPGPTPPGEEPTPTPAPTSTPDEVVTPLTEPLRPSQLYWPEYTLVRRQYELKDQMTDASGTKVSTGVLEQVQRSNSTDANWIGTENWTFSYGGTQVNESTESIKLGTNQVVETIWMRAGGNEYSSSMVISPAFLTEAGSEIPNTNPSVFMSALGWVDVTVPAGTYRCAKLWQRIDAGPTAVHNVYLYMAPGYGLVKSVSIIKWTDTGNVQTATRTLTQAEFAK